MLSVIRIHTPHNLAYKAIISWGGRSDRVTFELVLRAE